MKFPYVPGVKDYDFGYGHPFRGDRFPKFVRFIRRLGAPIEIIDPVGEPPTFQDLLRVHDKGYLDKLIEMSRKGFGLISLDTPAFKGMWEASLSLVYSALSAIRVALREGSSLGFGGAHHAGVREGGGFCLINDVAVAARWAQSQGVDRVLIFDHDAHHGNGTMEIFYEDDSVLYVSLHQDPATIYPGVGFLHQVGRGKGEGYTVNVPLPPKAGPESYKIAIEELVVPITESFDADLVIAHGGSDPHYSDPLTNLGQTIEGLWELGGWASSLKSKSKVNLLISGYNEEIRNWGWLALSYGFMGEVLPKDPREVDGSPEIEDDRVIRRTRALIDEGKKVFSKYWNVRG